MKRTQEKEKKRLKKLEKRSAAKIIKEIEDLDELVNKFVFDHVNSPESAKLSINLEGIENADVDSTSTSVTLNENGILIKEQNKEEVDKEVKSVKISKDGITIKTK